MAVRAYLLLCGLLILAASPLLAQKIAILTPENNRNSVIFGEKLGEAIAKKFTVLDSSLTETAFRSVVMEDPFNQTQDESKKVGAVMGCNQFLLIKSETLRRSSSDKPEYYEAYIAVYVVSSRSGRLAFWTLRSEEAANPAKAENSLAEAIEPLATEIADKLKKVEIEESVESSTSAYPEIPAENSPEAKGFRPPVPYLRIKPEYTRLAYLYGIKGTVDVLIDLDEKGNIQHAAITRWAGYGLDEAVIAAVRKMNWRPAERAGKPLAIRFLLRYNFKKIEKE